jgi:predicted secreted protein
MKKLTRNLALAVILTTTCGAFAHADDIPTGTDPVPPTHPSSGSSTTATTIAAILAALYGVVL